jgi:hypothetical protein
MLQSGTVVSSLFYNNATSTLTLSNNNAGIQFNTSGVSAALALASTGAATFVGGIGGINFTNSTTITNTASSGYTAIYANGGGIYLGGSASVNHMSILGGGQVGIGVVPSAWNTGYKVLQLNNSSIYGDVGATPSAYFGNKYYVNSSGNAYYLNSATAGALGIEGNSLVFYAAPSGTSGTVATLSERMRITSGTFGGYLKASNNGSYRSSTGSFHEFNTNKDNDAAVVIQNSGSNPYLIFASFTTSDPNNSTNYIFRGYSDAAGLALYTIFSNGTTAGRSDIRLKKNIQDATPKLDSLMKLRVVNYEWKQSINGSKEIGLIAQEVEEVFPNLVITEPIIKEREIVKEDGSIENEKYEDGDSKSLKNSVLPYITIKAVQELYDLVKEQQAQIEELKELIKSK